jgi:hypothetical protein
MLMINSATVLPIFDSRGLFSIAWKLLRKKGFQSMRVTNSEHSGVFCATKKNRAPGGARFRIAKSLQSAQVRRAPALAAALLFPVLVAGLPVLALLSVLAAGFAVFVLFGVVIALLVFLAVLAAGFAVFVLFAVVIALLMFLPVVVAGLAVFTLFAVVIALLVFLSVVVAGLAVFFALFLAVVVALQSPLGFLLGLDLISLARAAARVERAGSEQDRGERGQDGDLNFAQNQIHGTPSFEINFRIPGAPRQEIRRELNII